MTLLFVLLLVLTSTMEEFSQQLLNILLGSGHPKIISNRSLQRLLEHLFVGHAVVFAERTSGADAVRAQSPVLDDHVPHEV